MVRHQADKDVLRSEIHKKDIIIAKQEETLKNKDDEIVLSKNEKLKAEEDLLKQYMSNKERIDKRAHSIAAFVNAFIILLAFVYLISVVLFYLFSNSENKELIAGLIAIVPPIVVFIISLIMNKSFNVIEAKITLIYSIESSYKQRHYKRNHINLDEIERLKKEIQNSKSNE